VRRLSFRAAKKYSYRKTTSQQPPVRPSFSRVAHNFQFDWKDGNATVSEWNRHDPRCGLSRCPDRDREWEDTTVAYEGGRRVQIAEDELERSRQIRAEIDKHMHALGAIIARSLGENTDGVRLGGALIKFDNTKVMIETAGKCWVEEDPPGESGECTPAERDSMIVCMAPVAPDELLTQ
jgi:hypothetical protein